MTPWLFLRGLVREQRHWGSFPDEFRQAMPDAEVMTLDLPGNGALCGEISPSSVEKMAQYYRKELADRGLTPPFRLLAMSLGAMVAVSWCESRPDDVEACVLINTSLRPFSPFYRRLRPENYLKMIAATWRSDARQRERLILQLTSCRGDAQSRLLDEWTAYQAEFPVTRSNAIRQLLAAIRYHAPTEKPKVPILVMGSTDDRLVNVSCSHVLAARWRTESVFHPTAGHDLPLDDGPWVAREVCRWLNSQASRQRL